MTDAEITAEKQAGSHLLSVFTPDSVGPIAMSCLLAAQGPTAVVRRQGAHAVNQFQGLVSSYPPNSAEGIFLCLLERVAYSAAATMIEADQEAKAAIDRAQQDYENALLGASVKSQINIGILKWLVRVLGFMGMSFFLTRWGVDLAGTEMSDGQRIRAQWLPYVFMFAVPVFIGVSQSLWRVYTTINLVYQRDLRIVAARKTRRAKQKAAVRYAKDQARLAWEDFVEPGTYLPTAQPTLDLLHVLYMEELKLHVAPPLNVLIMKAAKRRWQRVRIKTRKRSKKNKK